MNAPPSSYRLFGCLRFLLAILVVVSHGLLLAGDTLLDLKPWGLGNSAVMVFFILSGYIIAEACDTFYRSRMRSFLLNRALRILPPFFIALMLSIALHLWLQSHAPLTFFDYTESPEGIFSAKNYLANFLSSVVLYGLGHVDLAPDYPFVRYMWAVRVELHFYIVYAFIYWLAHRNHPWSRYVMPLALSGIAVLALLAAITKASMLNYFYFAPYFVLGVALHYWCINRSRISLGIGMASAIAVAANFIDYVGKGDDAYITGPLALLVILTLAIVPLARVRASQPLQHMDTWLGNLAYPIYLNHYAVAILMLNIAPAKTLGWFMLYTLACIVFSYIASLVTEPLTTHLRNRIRGTALR